MKNNKFYITFEYIGILLITIGVIGILASSIFAGYANADNYFWFWIGLSISLGVIILGIFTFLLALYLLSKRETL